MKKLILLSIVFSTSSIAGTACLFNTNGICTDGNSTVIQQNGSTFIIKNDIKVRLENESSGYSVKLAATPNKQVRNLKSICSFSENIDYVYSYNKTQKIKCS